MVNSDATLRIYLQYYEREINLTRMMEKAYIDGTARLGGPVTELAVYVKPEDGKAYYVANGKYEYYVNLWDSDKDLYNGNKLSGEISWYTDVKSRLVFEYRGRQCDGDSIIDRAVEKFVSIYTADKLQEVEIYVRQESETAYYVINGRHTGSIAMFA